jgi:hypothetical protein
MGFRFIKVLFSDFIGFFNIEKFYSTKGKSIALIMFLP